MKPHKNALEWTVFAASAVVIAGVVALLVWNGTAAHDQPPLLRIRTGEPVADGEVFRVPVEVRNEGDRTAEGAQIEILLLRDGQAIERAELMLPFVPRHSSRSGWVTFRHDPRCCAITARAVGYNAP